MKHQHRPLSLVHGPNHTHAGRSVNDGTPMIQTRVTRHRTPRADETTVLPSSYVLRLNAAIRVKSIDAKHTRKRDRSTKGWDHVITSPGKAKRRILITQTSTDSEHFPLSENVRLKTIGWTEALEPEMCSGKPHPTVWYENRVKYQTHCWQTTTKTSFNHSVSSSRYD